MCSFFFFPPRVLVKAFAVEDGAAKEYTVTFLQDGQSHDMLTVDRDGNSKIVPDERENTEEAEEPAPLSKIQEPLSKADTAYDWSVMPENVQVFIDVEPNLGSPNYFVNRNLASGKVDMVPGEIQVFMRTDELLDGRGAPPNLFDKVDADRLIDWL